MTRKLPMRLPFTVPRPDVSAAVTTMPELRLTSAHDLSRRPEQTAAAQAPVSWEPNAPVPLVAMPRVVGRGSEVAVRISVVDAGDHMVYSDLRDRRGWQQPLSAAQTARELGRREGALEDRLPVAPRTFKTLELMASSQIGSEPAGPVVSNQSPYRAGKSNVAKNGLTSAPTPVAGIAARQISTQPLALPTRGRGR